MQTKIGMISLLQNYRLTVNEKTIEPFQMVPTSIVLAVKGEVWLNAEKIWLAMYNVPIVVVVFRNLIENDRS